MSDLVERAAEAAWQAESLRASGRSRLAPWAEANPEIQDAWRDTVRAIIPIVRADALEEAAREIESLTVSNAENEDNYFSAENALDHIRSLAKG